jgi:hypothetical protein
MNASALVGLLLMIGSQTGTLLQVEPFWSWNTPIAWTGFILFADSIVWQIQGNSWIRSNPREFALLSCLSIGLWLIFELYNQVLNNWYYVGLPESAWLRYFGYAWSFSTIWPAIFEGAELVGVLRARGAGGRRPDQPLLPERGGPVRVSWVVIGALMLVSPLLVTSSVARYMAAPVWLGFIFLLDPINRSLGEESLLNDFAAGRYDRLNNLVLSGFLCGILWEFWNYWSRGKWHYTVPIMEDTKIFEMPVPGYFGFPAFALECFTMYAFVRGLSGRRGRPIAL